MVFENIAKEFLKKQNQNLRKNLVDIGRLETEINSLKRKLRIETKNGNKIQVKYYTDKLKQRIKEFNRARMNVIFAEGMKRR